MTKFLVAYGAGLMALWAARRFSARDWAGRAQTKHLQSLQRSLAVTAYGKRRGIVAGMSEKVWQEKVPLCTYETIESFVERMKGGEADLLWPGICRIFARTSATTGDSAKTVPVTKEMVAHFRQSGLDSVLLYSAREDSLSVFQGKHLYLGGAIMRAFRSVEMGCLSSAGKGKAITAINLPGWMDQHFYEPGSEIAAMEDWSEMIQVIARRSVGVDIRLISGIPCWLLIVAKAVLAESARLGRPAATLRDVWPNLESVIHGGHLAGPFAEELIDVCGDGVVFQEVYSAAEGFIAIQDAGADAGMRLLADAGIYYEFLPLVEYDENRLDQLGGLAVPLTGVKTGVDYVLIVTTPAGLCRYVMGDIVRFVATEPARLLYSGRTALRLNAFGECIVERELTDALADVCRRNHWYVVNFHVAPIFASSLTGEKDGGHEWWLELQAGTESTPTGPVIAEELDARLRRLNEDYREKRTGGRLALPIVRLVMPGVFEYWQRETGRWGGENKMPRCRGDRRIADELARIARFHDSN